MNKRNNKSNITTKLDSKTKRRLTICLIFSFMLLIALIIRMSWLQFATTVNGHNLKEEAFKKQLTNKTIIPKRGNLYDSTGNGLALSAEVDTISVNPSRINSNKEELAKTFGNIFELDYNEVLQKLNSDSPSVKIAEKVKHEQVLQLEEWLEYNKTKGISITPDTRRFYPHNNLASNLIGFTGTDNQGLSGLESSLDDLLSGTARQISYNYRFH